MLTQFEGKLTAEGFRFALVVGRFNHFITERLLDGAIDALVRHGASEEMLRVIRVPGSWEIPLAARWLVDSGNFDAVICLGAVIRGGTPHFEYVAAEVTKGIANLSLQSGIPVTLGVITTDSVEQAIERAGTKSGNKGWEAALSAIEMVNLKRVLTAER